MKDISTSRLRELLENATPGPWRADDTTGEIYDTNGKQVAYPLAQYDNETWIEWATDADHILAAAAPELAEEVIRLREELASLRDGLKEDGEKIGATASEMDEFATCGRIAKQLTRILEGDQA